MQTVVLQALRQAFGNRGSPPPTFGKSDIDRLEAKYGKIL
jgi:hypothetical protein